MALKKEREVTSKLLGGQEIQILEITTNVVEIIDVPWKVNWKIKEKIQRIVLILKEGK